MEASGSTGERRAQEGGGSERAPEDTSAGASEEEVGSESSAAEDETAVQDAPGRDEDSGDDESEVDAMGQPKRRAVVGQGYGPSKTRRLVLYVGVLLLVVAAYIGAQYAITKLDVAPAQSKPQAPWAQPKVHQIPPQQFQ